MDFVCWLFWMKMVTFDSKFHSKCHFAFIFIRRLTNRQKQKRERSQVRPSRSRKPNFKAIIKRTKTKEVSTLRTKKMQQQLHSIEMWLDFRPTFSSRVSLLFKPFFFVTLAHLHKTAKNKNMIFNFPQSFYPWFWKKIFEWRLQKNCKQNKTDKPLHEKGSIYC